MGRRRIGMIASILVVAVVFVLLLGRSYVFADSGGTTGLGFDDPYTQIVNHEIPIQSDVTPAAFRDGKPSYFEGGRQYLGPNGWEIRYTSDGTWTVVQVAAGASSLAAGTIATGGLSTLGEAALANSPKLAAVTTVASVAKPLIDKPLQRAVLGNQCLGVTIARPNVGPVLDAVVILREVAATEAEFIKLATGQYTVPFKHVVVWFEPCAPGDGPKADIAAPPAPPVGDTQPAVKAAPIPVPAQPAQPAAPVAVQAPQPAPVTQAAPPPPPLAQSEACWTAGPDYRTYVRTSNQTQVLFYEREHESVQLQVPNPKWMHWTQNTGSQWQIEGQYKDSNGQDMWPEGNFFAADFWTSDPDTADKDRQFDAYNQLKDSWNYDMNLVATATQC